MVTHIRITFTYVLTFQKLPLYGSSGYNTVLFTGIDLACLVTETSAITSCSSCSTCYTFSWFNNPLGPLLNTSDTSINHLPLDLVIVELVVTLAVVD